MALSTSLLASSPLYSDALLSSHQVLERCAFEKSYSNLISIQSAFEHMSSSTNQIPALVAIVSNSFLILFHFFHACQYNLGNTESLTSSSGRHDPLTISNSCRAFKSACPTKKNLTHGTRRCLHCRLHGLILPTLNVTISRRLLLINFMQMGLSHVARNFATMASANLSSMAFQTWLLCRPPRTNSIQRTVKKGSQTKQNKRRKLFFCFSLLRCHSSCKEGPGYSQQA